MVAVGFGVSSGMYNVLGYSFGFGIILDDSWNYGSYTFHGAGWGTPGASAGLSFSCLGSSGDTPATIRDFGGPFANASVGYSAGVSGSIDPFLDPANPSHFGASITLGAGTPGPGVSVGGSDTTVSENNFLTDLA